LIAVRNPPRAELSSKEVKTGPSAEGFEPHVDLFRLLRMGADRRDNHLMHGLGKALRVPSTTEQADFNILPRSVPAAHEQAHAGAIERSRYRGGVG
jgi:hypothetical protein